MKGIGIDTTSVAKTRDLLEALGRTYVDNLYTPAEQREYEKASEPAVYLAGRFAVKEAVFKAIAHLLDEKTFDLRVVETLDAADGSPSITVSEELADILSRAGASKLFVSITTEGDAATAIVVAC